MTIWWTAGRKAKMGNLLLLVLFLSLADTRRQRVCSGKVERLDEEKRGERLVDVVRDASLSERAVVVWGVVPVEGWVP